MFLAGEVYNDDQCTNLMNETEFKVQVEQGERFEFGKNWKSFLTTLSSERIKIAENSLTEMMGIDDLSGIHLLDIGCGSGLFSLAAKNLNASVHSIDFDQESVNCTKYLKEKFHPGSNWKVEEGSVLNESFINKLGKFDIVYSWGVLHHTGNMKLALQNAALPVKPNGLLFISIYNDQRKLSKFWLKVKQVYNSSLAGKFLIIVIFYPLYALIGFLADILRFKNPFTRYSDYKRKRGMSMTHDWADWLGGLPFETATPEFIFDFYKSRGFYLEKMTTTNLWGCNQFVFRKSIS